MILGDPERGIWDANIGEGISEAEALFLLQTRLKGVERGISRRWKPWSVTPPKVQAVLLDMGYQLGVEWATQVQKDASSGGKGRLGRGDS